MRIALVHYAANPVIGGVENVMREHARLMVHSGHHVSIIAGRGEQVDAEVDFRRLPLIDSIAPEVLELKRALDAGVIPADFSRVSAEIEVQLRRNLDDIDCLLVHNICSLNKNLAATSALRRLAETGRWSMGLWHHDLAWTTPRYRSQLHERLPWNLLKQEWPGVVQVTVSESRRRELAALLSVPVGRIRAVPNGIEPYRFLGLDGETASLVRRFGLLEADPLLLLPARITPRKNIELALRVLNSLMTNWPAARLLITGPMGAHNTENSAYLESLTGLSRSLGTEEAVLFLSLRADKSVSDDTIRQLYRLADGLLLPSREEGFGIPILEAGLAGIPIFCSAIEPLIELGKSEAIYFTPDEDPGEVAEKITATLKTDRTHAARKRVLQEYSWEHIERQHLGPILEELSR